MHVMPPPFVPIGYSDASAYIGPELIEAQRAANLQIRAKVQATFRAVCGAGLEAVWQEAEGDRASS